MGSTHVGVMEDEVLHYTRRLCAKKGPELDPKRVKAALLLLSDDRIASRVACEMAGIRGDSHSQVLKLSKRIWAMRAAAGTAAALQTLAASDEREIGTIDASDGMDASDCMDIVETSSANSEGEKEAGAYPASNLLELPDDVWAHALKELGTKELSVLATTCRTLHKQQLLAYALDRGAFVDELVEALVEDAVEKREAPRCARRLARSVNRVPD